MNNKYVCRDICVCVVTYNPDDITWANIENISNQVGRIVVVDNSDDVVSKNVAKKACEKKCEYISNGGNKGLAYALNQGYYYAKKNNYKLYMTLDQDSECAPQMIENLVLCLNNNEKRTSVGPCWNDEGISKDEEVKYLITSGNITPTVLIDEIGGFDEDFFIDSVDMDFSLSLRKIGCKLYKVKNAILNHKIGEIEKSYIFKIPYLSHSPRRMYYIYRNHILLRKKYFKDFPIFIIRLYLFHILETLKIIFIERNKMRKIQNAIDGVVAGLNIRDQQKRSH